LLAIKSFTVSSTVDESPFVQVGEYFVGKSASILLGEKRLGMNLKGGIRAFLTRNMSQLERCFGTPDLV
jgi:hypothetical protein